MLTYAPRVFAPEHVAEIFSEVLFANRSIGRGLVRGVTDILHSQGVTSLTGDIELGARIDHVTDAVVASRSNNLAFSDGTLVPQQLMALEFFNMNELRNTRFGRTMNTADRTFQSSEFDTAVLDYTLPRIGKSYERRMHVGITAISQAAIAASGSAVSAATKAWAAAQTPGLVDGFVARMVLGKIAGANIAILDGVTVTATNIATEYGKLYSNADGAVAGNPETVIFAPLSDRSLILQYNLAQTNRDTFVVTGMGTEAEMFMYLGVPIEFVETQGRQAGAATGVPARYLGRGKDQGDFVYGTNLTSALNSATIEKVNTFSTLLGMRMDVTLDTLVLVPQQKVLYL
ncbi:hypothetical protein [Hymenobacter sp.]|uniref:hypothetical protein n=1 Tax=Hymenobacter sp. TaxID=1898978 RepID=UPI00286ABC19|nr:hypothetical protein [Hymenobacter sp.]